MKLAEETTTNTIGTNDSLLIETGGNVRRVNKSNAFSGLVKTDDISTAVPASNPSNSKVASEKSLFDALDTVWNKDEFVPLSATSLEFTNTNLSGVVTIDFNAAENANRSVFAYTLTGNATLHLANVPSNMRQVGFRFQQSGSGQFSVTFGNGWDFMGGVAPEVIKGMNPVGKTRLVGSCWNGFLEVSYNNVEQNRSFTTSDSPALPQGNVAVMYLVDGSTTGAGTFTLPASPRVTTMAVWNWRTGAMTTTQSIRQSGNATPSTKSVPVNEVRVFDFAEGEWMMR